MPQSIKIQYGASTDELVISPTAPGLQQVVSGKSHPGDTTIVIETIDLPEEAKVNFIAMWAKCQRHLRFVLGLPGAGPQSRTQVWRKYFRNKVDAEHNEGRPFVTFMNSFLTSARLSNVRFTETEISITGSFQSSVILAAAIGRIVNMLRWCRKYTSAIKLVSEANMTWDTFNKISLAGEQPIIRRRK